MNRKNSLLLIILILGGPLYIRGSIVPDVSDTPRTPSPYIENEPEDSSVQIPPVPSPQVPPSTTKALPPVLTTAGTQSAQGMLMQPTTALDQPVQQVSPTSSPFVKGDIRPTVPASSPPTTIPGEPGFTPTLTKESFKSPADTIGQPGTGALIATAPEEQVTSSTLIQPVLSPLSESRTKQPEPEQFSGTEDVNERTDVPLAREEVYKEQLAQASTPAPVSTPASTRIPVPAPAVSSPKGATTTVISPGTKKGGPAPQAATTTATTTTSQPIFKEVAPAGASQAPTAVVTSTKPAPVAPAPQKSTARRRGRQRRQLQEETAPFSLADTPKTAEEKALYKEAVEGDRSRKIEEQQTSATYKKLTQSGAILLGDYLEPWRDTDPNELIEMNFENKELSELLKFLSNNLNITFLLDDYIEPQRAEGMQPIAQTKITFKSTIPLTLKQAWELGLTFLEMSGFSVIPATLPRTYRVTASTSKTPGGASANREPLPTFIGTDPDLLPNNDSKIRYVYFVENAELPTAVQIIEAMKSGSSGPLIEITPMRALILTDRAAIIKSITNILREIDSAALPETLAIIRLKHKDARQVRELYHRLIGKDPSNPVFNPFTRQRKPTTTQYFTEATRVFEEPFSNSLIVLGTRENIKRFEDFILTHVDRSIDIPFSPLHVIQLKYIDAQSTAKILMESIQRFNGANPSYADAAAVGGVRDSNKFFRPSVRITDEPFGNRLIINANYDEYLKLSELIEGLDVEQPQCAIKLLILNVDLTNRNEIGTQLRNRADCCPTSDCTNGALGPNVNFQTSNIGPIITNPNGTSGNQTATGAERLLGNLIQLANLSSSGVSPFPAGTTLVTLGQDAFGFFGLLQALESYTRVSVLANPFFVTTHKYKAELKIGETRRTTTALVEGSREAQAQGDLSADLRVVITPQISYDDMVTLNIYVELGQFTDPTSTNRLVKKISTEALLANKEVLALGGLIRDNVSVNITKVPILGDIPLIGWLFKQEVKVIERTSLLILIQVEIIKPHEPEVAQAFTFSKITDAKDTLRLMQSETYRRDPIHRWIFNDHKDREGTAIDKFAATQQRYVDENQRQALEKSMIVGMEDTAPVQDKSLLDLVKGKKQSQGVQKGVPG